MNTNEFLEIACAIVPERTAIVFEGGRITYAELKDRVSRLANALGALGVGAGDRVAMIEVNRPEHIEAYFATAALDAVFVPLNYRSRGDELAYMIGESGPRVVLVGARYVDLLRSVAGELESVEAYVAVEGLPARRSGRYERWHAYEELMAAAPDAERAPRADGGDLTMIMFTTGTTGAPKGAMLSHDSFSSYMLSSVTPADPEVDERVILSVPLYHIAGAQAVLAAVYGGRTIVVQRQFESGEWLELVERERVTRTMMVPTMLKRVMEHPDFASRDLSSLELITYGAAPMPLEVIRRAVAELPGTRFINAFGQTETAATITMLPPEDHVLDGPPAEVEKRLRRLSSIGKPLDDVEVRIADEDGNLVAAGVEGEIVARGARLMKGYWHNPAATAGALHDGWLHTGDLGYADEDGYIFLTGRARDFIKRGGEMISPLEVEQVLTSHPAIDDAAVIGVADADWGERVRAIVVLKGGGSAGEDEIIRFARERLASFKKPESVVFVPELPRNALGKILKTELRERYGTRPDGVV